MEIDLIEAPFVRAEEAQPQTSPADASYVYPCSEAQRGFWLEEQLHPNNPGLNVAARWRIRGDLSNATLEEAWHYLFIRHDALRTQFEMLGGEPVQAVKPRIMPSVTIHDLRGSGAEAARLEAERLALAHARTPFDLTKAPLLSVSRILLEDTQSILLVTAHHAICDGWSVGILAKEMGEICAALQRGEPIALPDLPLRYVEFAEAENEWLRNESFDSEIATLRTSLHGLKQFELVTDHPRPAVQTYNSNIASLPLDRSSTDALGQIARRNGCTLFMVSFAVLLTLLHRYTGETDIAIGTQVAGRDEIEHEGIVGCFINTVPLRADLSGDPTFIELLARVTDSAGDSFELRHVPFERLVSLLKPKRDLSRTALFSVNFGLHSFVQDRGYEHFTLTDLPSYSAGPLYDLNFSLIERSGSWRVSCEYNTDLFDDDTVGDLIKRLELLMKSVIADPHRRLSNLALLSDADRHTLIVSSNQTRTEYPADQTVTALLAAQVVKTPTAIAVVCGNVKMTYAELDAASNRLARELIRRDLGPGKLVGVLLERSPELIVVLLAVLKAGSAYIPLDPEYPHERLALIVAKSRLAAVISRSALRDRFATPEASFVCVDADGPAIEKHAANPLESHALPTDLAYVIYTSGSTGTPKGVQIEHRALVNLLCAMAVSPGITAADVLVAVTTISFDIAALEIFLPLISGARLVLARESEVADGASLYRIIAHNAVTMMQATPVTWQLLIEGGWNGDPPLKMLCGGESLTRKLADQLLERGAELWNMYGPTETTIWSAAGRVRSEAGPVLVGPPIANTQFYVVDANVQLVPPGVPGELLIGGDGVARGYFDNPGLTRERFLADPFRGVAGATLYRTGDIVRRRGADEFEFFGRSDQQIKLRGFRIELGEIEAALLRQPGVTEAVAVVYGEGAEKAIWAFVAGQPENGESNAAWPARLRSSLGESLPQYMVPAPIVVLDALPRTPNGKVDRKALPQTVAAETSAPPQTGADPTETTLTALISEMLGRQSVCRNDNIFALGFHSLLAVRLVDRIAKSIGVRVPLRALYDAQTIAELAALLTSASASTPGFDDPKPALTLNPNGTFPPFIYFHNDLLADGMYCRRLAAAVGNQQPIHALAPHGTAGLPLVYTVGQIARNYLPQIRALQPHGPYRLGGFCAGGLVAYEVAQLLREQGESVERLALINAWPLTSRSNAVIDVIVRAIALNPLLPARLRKSFCYKAARLFEVFDEGPRSTISFIGEQVRRLFGRTKLGDPSKLADFEAVDERRARETASKIAQLVGSLTYHPKPYDGEVTLFWSIDQPWALNDIRKKWNNLVKTIRFIAIPGGHNSPMQESVHELGRALEDVLH